MWQYGVYFDSPVYQKILIKQLLKGWLTHGPVQHHQKVVQTKQEEQERTHISHEQRDPREWGNVKIGTPFTYTYIRRQPGIFHLKSSCGVELLKCRLERSVRLPIVRRFTGLSKPSKIITNPFILRSHLVTTSPLMLVRNMNAALKKKKKINTVHKVTFKSRDHPICTFPKGKRILEQSNNLNAWKGTDIPC